MQLLDQHVVRPDDMRAAEPKRGTRWNDRAPAVVVIVVGVIAAMVAAGRPFDTDGFWHVRDGEYILTHHTIPHFDPFSWTAGARTWHLDSWLYDVLAAGLRHAGGYAAVSLASLLAEVALAWAFYALARHRGAAAWPAVWVTTVATFLIDPWIAERAQPFGFLAFAAVLVLSERALRGSNRSVALLGVLIALWANLHLDVTLGIAIIVLLAGCHAFRARTLARPALVAMVAIVAGMMNPYGFSAFTLGLRVRGMSRYVQEWHPFDPTKPLDVLIVAFVLVTLFVMWRTRRMVALEALLPIVVLLALTIDSVRMGSFLLIASAPELARGVSRLDLRHRLFTAPRRHALAHGALLGIAALAIVAALQMRLPRPMPDTTYPVRSTVAIPAGCRLLNEYNQGGYILDHRWPDVLVSEDGRNDLYGEAELVAQNNVLKAGPGWQQWLDTNHVGCVLAYPYRPLVVKLRQAGWHQTASDPSAILLVRPGA